MAFWRNGLLAALLCAVAATAWSSEPVYQRKSLSPQHMRELQNSIHECASRVNGASDPEERSRCQEELCMALIQAEDYDRAIRVAQAIHQTPNINEERRAVAHFLVAQVYHMKMEASPNLALMEENRRTSGNPDYGKVALELAWDMTLRGTAEAVTTRTAEYTKAEVERLREYYRSRGEDPDSPAVKMKIAAARRTDDDFRQMGEIPDRGCYRRQHHAAPYRQAGASMPIRLNWLATISRSRCLKPASCPSDCVQTIRRR